MKDSRKASLNVSSTCSVPGKKKEKNKKTQNKKTTTNNSELYSFMGYQDTKEASVQKNRTLMKKNQERRSPSPQEKHDLMKKPALKTHMHFNTEHWERPLFLTTVKHHIDVLFYQEFWVTSFLPQLHMNPCQKQFLAAQFWSHLYIVYNKHSSFLELRAYFSDPDTLLTCCRGPSSILLLNFFSPDILLQCL